MSERTATSIWLRSCELGWPPCADAMGPNGAPSSSLQGQIDTAVRAMIAREMERAVALVTEHRDAVEAVAEALLRQDVLTADEVIRIAADHGVVVEQQLSTV